MITALELTRRETLLLGSAAFASTIARPALAQKGPERHGMSAFGDLKYPAGFKHFDYVDPNAPKASGSTSSIGSRVSSTLSSRANTRAGCCISCRHCAQGLATCMPSCISTSRPTVIAWHCSGMEHA
jgi:hypothetical protein